MRLVRSALIGSAVLVLASFGVGCIEEKLAPTPPPVVLEQQAPPPTIITQPAPTIVTPPPQPQTRSYERSESTMSSDSGVGPFDRDKNNSYEKKTFNEESTY